MRFGNQMNRAELWLIVLGIIANGTAQAGVDNEAVTAGMVEFQGGAGLIKGYLARPKGDGPFPAVVVIHEWWGLSEWIKGNARRLAGEGYVALAVDLYGGKATSDPGEAHELMRALNEKEGVADLKGGIAYLESLSYVRKGRKLGVVGWCMGGGYARKLAQESEHIGPAAVCYGAVTLDTEELASLKGKPVLGIFGAGDRGIPADRVKQFASALKNQGNKVELHIYEGAGHGFMRPDGPHHNAKAAADAWMRIDDFFAANLKK